MLHPSSATGSPSATLERMIQDIHDTTVKVLNDGDGGSGTSQPSRNTRPREAGATETETSASKRTKTNENESYQPSRDFIAAVKNGETQKEVVQHVVSFCQEVASQGKAISCDRLRSFHHRCRYTYLCVKNCHGNDIDKFLAPFYAGAKGYYYSAFAKKGNQCEACLERKKQ